MWDRSHIMKTLPETASDLAKGIHARMVAAGLSQKALALKAGLGETFVREIFRGRSKNPGGSGLQKIAEVLECAVEDLSIVPLTQLPPRSARTKIPVTISIPELDVRAMGGAGADDAALDGNGAHPVLAHWSIPVDFLRSYAPSPEAVRIIRVVGDSMEPAYPAGDRVLVDTSHQTPSPPGVYVVWDGIGLMLKHVQILAGRTPPVAQLSSSNPAYETYEVPLADLKIQGRVMGKWVWK